MNPNDPAQYQPNQHAQTGEIDLFELIQSIWQEKVLIVIITAVITGLALTYALTATPIYKAQASLVPPPAYGIQGYNEGRLEAFQKSESKESQKNEFKEFSVEDIYKVYTRHLNSLQLRRIFFEDVYLSSISTDDRKINRDSLLIKFNNIFTVKLGDPTNNPDLYYVSVQLDDPVIAASWVNQYIERAIESTKNELRKNIEAEQKVRINSLSLKIKLLIDTAQKKREDQIQLLKEALYIAESTGLDTPGSLSDKASLGGNRYIDNDLIYTRGAKTLRAQLDVLEKRTSDEPFIEDFRKLNTQLELLQAFQLDDSNVSVVQIDEIAEVPSTAIKPKKSLIVAAGIVIGGMLGLFAALTRSVIRKRKTQRVKAQ